MELDSLVAIGERSVKIALPAIEFS